MDGTFERTSNETWLLLPEEEPAEEYACRLLEKNPGQHLLRLQRRKGKDGTVYAFSLSVGNSLAGLYRLRSLSFREMTRILSGVEQAVEEAEERLLDLDHLILDPELIFAMPDLDSIRLCCHPGFRQDFFEQLRALIRFFLRKTDHQDTSGTEAAYRLFEISEQEYFRLEDLMKEISRFSAGQSENVRNPYPPSEREAEEEEESGGESEKTHAGRLGEAAALSAASFTLLLAGWLRVRSGTWEPKLFAAAAGFGALFLLVRIRQNRAEKNAETEEIRKEKPAGDWRLIPQGKDAGEEILLKRFPLAVGKLKGETGILLDVPSISRIHARFTLEDGELCLTDCGSIHGTRVNGFILPPESPYPLQEGDEIRFADISYRLDMK